MNNAMQVLHEMFEFNSLLEKPPKESEIYDFATEAATSSLALSPIINPIYPATKLINAYDAYPKMPLVKKVLNNL